MSDSVPHLRTVWKDSFGDIEIYTDNTLEVITKGCSAQLVNM